jgi:2-O-(6-phospho-alpha-D-mannosyl)-D-glycerate hydrolase
VPILTFHLIPHTHWDREWHLPRAALHARLVRVLDDLVDQLGADPGYRSFLLDGQTILLEDYARARPERTAAIRELVRAGRLQVGPWYVLADELIPSGESLVRNLLLGAVDATRWGGRLDVLYSPDAFGHPACWPELARGSGIDAGVIWRGLGGAPGQEGDRYRWRGPSGAEVRLWHMPPSGYEVGVDLDGDPERLPEAWAWVRGQLVARATGRHIPVFIGADHRAAPPGLAPMRDQLAELEMPNEVRISRLDEFFAAASDEFRDAPVLTGELRFSPQYTWSLQGVHGTRAPLKRQAALAELWLERAAEPLAALARWGGGRDHRTTLEQAWRTLVQCQFHDTICGTTTDAVSREAEQRLDAVRTYADDVIRGALHEAVGHDPDRARERTTGQMPTLVLWNPVPRSRHGIVIADCTVFRRDVPVGPPGARLPRVGSGYEPFSLRPRGGRALAQQVLDRRLGLERIDAARHAPDQDEVDRVRVALWAPPVTGCGFVALRPGPGPGSAPRERVEVQGRSLINRFVVATLDRTGALMLYDRRTHGRWLDLLRLESGGDAGDTYTFSPPVRDRVVRSQGPIRVRRLAAGPLVAALEVTWRMPAGRPPVGRREGRGRVEVRLVVMLYADSPVVRCIFDLDNQATYHRLRARLPTGFTGGVVAGMQFGRADRAATSAAVASGLEAPVRTAPAHRFVAARGEGRGLALLAPGFFEYEYTPRGDLLFTLLRAVGALSRNDLPLRPGHAAWPTPTPGAQCPGRTQVELALAPLQESEFPETMWEHVFTPIRGAWIRDAVDLTLPTGGVTLEGVGLVWSALKPSTEGADSGMVLRCYNPDTRAVAGAWRLGVPVHAAFRTRLDEREPVPLVLEDGGRVVRFTAGPGEIVTVAVHRA